MLNPIYDISQQNDEPKHDEPIKNNTPKKNNVSLNGGNIIPPINVVPTEKEYLLTYPFGLMKIKIQNEQTFLFSDDNNTFIGQFTLNDIISYISSITEQLDPTAKKLIELTICKYEDTNLKLNTESVFMNDIELLIILNRMFKNIESQPTSENNNVKRFIYLLLEHTIMVLLNVSKQLKDNTDDALKQKLMRCSIGLVYRLTQHLNMALLETKNDCQNMITTIDKIKTIEENIETKITNIVMPNKF